MAKVIRTSKKEGFHCESDGCIIYDVRGLFLKYIKSVNFNLPAGTYTIKSGIVSALEKPVVYPLPVLPITEKHLDLSNTNINEIKNSSITKKACIDVANHDYYINPSWEKTLTTPQLVFCQNHEIGHFFYATQEKCDQWAEYYMLEEGFNPSQIAFASHDTLCGQCDSSKGLESLFGLSVPFESATRRLSTENRMKNASLIAAIANNANSIYDYNH
jgi:hypothetical protein